MAGLEVATATSARWADVVTVMGTRGEASRCWCQFFRQRGAQQREATAASNRAALCEQVRDGPVPPGVIAYVDDEPVGWCAVAPFTSYARLPHSPVPMAAHGPDDSLEGVWAVTCFVVRVGRRRQGIAGELVEGAVELARSRDATAVEGYPVDPARRLSTSSSELYHGTVSMFLAHGFSEVVRPSPARLVVRRIL